MNWKRTISIAVAVLVASSTLAQDPAFKVVVNSGVSMTSIDTKTLSRIFLRKDDTWPDGSSITAADLGADSEVREAFTTRVHGKKVSAIKSYWQRQIFAGKMVPPVEISSERDLLGFISATPGSVGYVSGSTPLIAGVKELELGD